MAKPKICSLKPSQAGPGRSTSQTVNRSYSLPKLACKRLMISATPARGPHWLPSALLFSSSLSLKGHTMALAMGGR